MPLVKSIEQLEAMILYDWGVGLAIGSAIASASASASAQMTAASNENSMRKRAADDAVVDSLRASKAAKLKAAENRRQGDALAARQRAAYAKSNVVSNVGTPLLVQTDTAKKVAEEAMLLSRDGEMAAHQGQTAAEWQRWMGQTATRSARWRAGSTLLSGASGASMLLAQNSNRKPPRED